jgi:hypothetical protein
MKCSKSISDTEFTHSALSMCETILKNFSFGFIFVHLGSFDHKLDRAVKVTGRNTLA